MILDPFDPDQTGLAPIAVGFTVALGKMLDAGRTVADDDVRLPYVRAANIKDSGLVLDDVKEMPFSTEERVRLDLRRGDLLVVEGGAVGTSTVLQSDLEGWSFQKTVNRVRSKGDWSARYLGYVLRAYRDEGIIDLVCNGSTIPHLTAEKLRSLRIPANTPAVQRDIADYLDRETARIDTLIEEQQRLIETLQERRAALISHVVLDASSERTQLRRLVDVIDCAHVTAEFVDDDDRFPVASIRECQGPSVDLTACGYTTAEFFEHLRSGSRAPRVGDLLFIRNVSVGLVSVVTPDLPEFAMGQETVLLRRKAEVHPSFLRYALLGAEARHEIEGAMIGSTFRRINVSAIRALSVAMPSLKEQLRIAGYLDEQTERIDELIAETERFIELSRERRAALVTAAVTGQIDVREVA